MTTDKTSALIEALNYIVSHAWVANTPTAHKWINEFVEVANNALAAFEQPVAREMTVAQAEEYIYSETKRFTETSALLALAKLGTIRVVEG